MSEATTAEQGRFCPVCEGECAVFDEFRGRPDAICPHCLSLERHRFAWKYLRDYTDLFNGKRKSFFHAAPERALGSKFKQLENVHYVSGDLLNRKVMVTLDLRRIGFADNSFDVIFCSHVLEHIDDDRGAMRELQRVLKPGGWAIIVVPITVKETFEDPSVADPKERARLFGQEDHIRRYGPDIGDRLREAGFDVRPCSAKELYPEEFRRRIGVSSYLLYHCMK